MFCPSAMHPPEVEQHTPEAQSALAPHERPSSQGAQLGAWHVPSTQLPDAQSPSAPQDCVSMQKGAHEGDAHDHSGTIRLPVPQPPVVMQHTPEAQSASASQSRPSAQAPGEQLGGPHDSRVQVPDAHWLPLSQGVPSRQPGAHEAHASPTQALP
jgi:hypothetical protein